MENDMFDAVADGVVANTTDTNNTDENNELDNENNKQESSSIQNENPENKEDDKKEVQDVTREVSINTIVQRSIFSLLAGFISVPFVYGFSYISTNINLTLSWFLITIFLNLFGLASLPIIKMMAEYMGDKARFKEVLSRGIRFSLILSGITWIMGTPMIMAVALMYPDYMSYTVILVLGSFFLLSHLMFEGIGGEGFALPAFVGTTLALPFIIVVLFILSLFNEPLAFNLFAGPSVFFLLSFFSTFSEFLFNMFYTNFGWDLTRD